MVTPGCFPSMCLDSSVGERAGRGTDMKKRVPKEGVGKMFEGLPAPPYSHCCLETFGENANEQETEGPHDCINSYTNTATRTATQSTAVKWLIMITTDKLMAALI